MPVAIITGASRGLGLALTRALSARDWTIVVDARDADALDRAVDRLPGVVALAGDVADDWHRGALVAAAGDSIDLLVNNASRLGPSPQPTLAAYQIEELRRVYEADVFAPLALVQAALPHLAPGAAIVNLSSDAAVEAYAGWGGYGSAKAALDQLSAILAAERPDLRVYAADPGDMRTRMHQEAFPGEDISDRPLPETSVPGLLALIDGHPAERPLPRPRTRPSARVSALELAPHLEAHEPPEQRGLGRDDVALLVATRHDGRLQHARFPRAAAVPGAGRPAGREHVGDACRQRSTHGSASAGSSSACRRRSTPASWVVELRTDTGEPLRRPPIGACLDAPGRCRAELLARYADSDRLSRRATLGRPSDSATTSHRHGHPIRYGYVPEPLADRRLPDRVRARARQRRDAERRTAVHDRARDRARRARDSRRSAHAAHRRLVARAGRAAVPRALRRARDDRTPRERRARLGRSRDRSRHDGRPCTRDCCRPGRLVAAGEGRTTPRRHARSAACTRSTDCSPAGTSREASHLLMLEAAAGPELLDRSYRVAAEHGYLWHEFGDIHLVLP